MDRYLQRAANVALADLADHGGGTYERGTLLPFTPSDGFAVAVGGIKLPEAEVTAESLAWACKAVAGEFITSYVGTWLDEGFVYIDAVEFWRDRAYAIGKGIEHGQQAIYSFADKEVITL